MDLSKHNINYITLQQNSDFDFWGAYYWISRQRHCTKSQIKTSVKIREDQEQQLYQNLKKEVQNQNIQELQQDYIQQNYSKLVDDPCSYKLDKIQKFEERLYTQGFSQNNIVNYETYFKQYQKWMKVKYLFEFEKNEQQAKKMILLYHYVFYLRVLINQPVSFEQCQQVTKNRVYGFFAVEFYKFEKKKMVREQKLLVVDFLRGIIQIQNEGQEEMTINFVQLHDARQVNKTGEIKIEHTNNQGDSKKLKIQAKYIIQAEQIVEVLNLCKQSYKLKQEKRIMNPNVEKQYNSPLKKNREQDYRKITQLKLVSSDNIIPPKAIITATVIIRVGKDKDKINKTVYLTLGNNNIVLHYLNFNFEPVYLSVIPINHDYICFQEIQNQQELAMIVSGEKISLKFESAHSCSITKQAIQAILKNKIQMNQICMQVPIKQKAQEFLEKFQIAYCNQILRQQQYLVKKNSKLAKSTDFIEDLLYYDEDEKRYKLQDELVIPDLFHIDIGTYLQIKQNQKSPIYSSDNLSSISNQRELFYMKSQPTSYDNIEQIEEMEEEQRESPPYQSKIEEETKKYFEQRQRIRSMQSQKQQYQQQQQEDNNNNQQQQQQKQQQQQQSIKQQQQFLQQQLQQQQIQDEYLVERNRQRSEVNQSKQLLGSSSDDEEQDNISDLDNSIVPQFRNNQQQGVKKHQQQQLLNMDSSNKKLKSLSVPDQYALQQESEYVKNKKRIQQYNRELADEAYEQNQKSKKQNSKKPPELDVQHIKGMWRRENTIQ